MLTVFYVLIAILLFGFLIAIHEFGHFMVAKLCGIQVNEFSICMGPKLFSKKVGETVYSLRCIPIGGYCAMEGEDEESENPRAFTRAKVWKRLLVLTAGSFMNFVVGLLMVVLFVSLFDLTGDNRLPSKQISGFLEDCPYESADAFQVGDELYSVDGERIYIRQDFEMMLERSATHVYDIVVLRNGEKVELKKLKLEKQDYNGGKYYGFLIPTEAKTVGSVLSYSWNTARDFTRLVRLGLQDLLTGKAGMKDMSGPVGVVSIVADAGASAETVRLGMENVLYLFAFIAINLAVMNMLPLPALDGGRIFLLLVTSLIERITRKKVNPKYEGYIHAVGMVLLLALMALITFKDVFNIFK